MSIPGYRRAYSFVLCLVALSAAWDLSADGLSSNTWVRPSVTGNLLYRHDEHGVRITDFSRCGYMGGQEELPDVSRRIDQSRWLYINPNGASNDANRIQAAIDTVAGWNPTNGFCGVLYFMPGDYFVEKTLRITNSGVVLKGNGQDQTYGSRIWATSPTQYTVVESHTSDFSVGLSGHTNFFDQRIVPAGTRTFRLADTTDLAATNVVLLTRPSTSNWVSDIDMDQLEYVSWDPFHGYVTNSMGENWGPERFLQFMRQIVRIDGPWVTVDSPLPQTFEQQYGGGMVQRVMTDERFENVGVEDLFFGSFYQGGACHSCDSNHGWIAVRFSQTKNAWVRRVTSRYFGMSTVSLGAGSHNVSVVECQNIDPVSPVSGGYRYSFHMEGGDHNLVRDCTASGGRHDFALGPQVSGPNANVRGKATDAHDDIGPHFHWAVGCLYDLIETSGSWWDEAWDRVAITAQNRGRNSTGHGWAGAFMTAWNCKSPLYRIRNPPTARNWLIGSIGYPGGSQFAVGADPDGTYDMSGPEYLIPMMPPVPLGHHVHPYSLYFAQLQQRLRWPGSEFRENWLGDIDDFGLASSPDDTAPVDSAFLTLVQENAGGATVTSQFDRLATNQETAFTFNVPLAGTQHVVAASLVLSLKATGPASPDDQLYLDDPKVGRLLRAGGLGWTIDQDHATVETLEIAPALLVDGRLNVAIRRNVTVDWAVLHTQVSPLSVSVQTLYPTDDTYCRGGSHHLETFGSDPDFRAKNEGSGDNSRRAYLKWNMSSVTAPVVGATVRLYCQTSAQEGNVFYAALTQHNQWGELGLNWDNQPPSLPPFAYFVPTNGGFVEFSVLPQVAKALAGDRLLGLQLWPPYDLGDAGFSVFSSKEAAVSNQRPQLILQFRNMPPTLPVFSNISIAMNSHAGPLSFSITDSETPAGNLGLSASSSNPALVPVSSIVFGGSGASRTLTVTPLTNQTGVADITVVLSDGAQSVSSKFTLRVGVPTISPVFSNIPDQVLSEHKSSKPVPFSITDAYGHAGDIPVVVSSILVPRGPTVRASFQIEDVPPSTPTNVSHRTVVFTPEPGFTGSALLTLKINDGFTNVSQSVQVTVTEVDDPPGPISLVDPGETSFVPNQPLTLEAVVVDKEGDLARVEFNLGTNILGIATNFPYRVAWTNPPAGEHSITATVVDTAAHRTTSAPVIFQVGQEYEYPLLLALMADTNTVTLAWAADGRNAQLQSTDRLTPSADWTNVNSVVVQGDVNQTTLPIERSASRFFRLLQLP